MPPPGIFDRLRALLAFGRRDAFAAIPRARVHPPERWEKAWRLAEARDDAAPDPQRLVQLAYAWLGVDEVDRAAAAFEEALRLEPRRHDALAGLGNARREQGRIADAVALYQRALEAAPNHLASFQNLLFSMLCLEGATEEEVFAWHLRYAERFEAPLRASWQPHANSRDPERVLRVGYVSPDFWRHVVGFCMAPVIEGHDRAAVEVTCYSNRHEGDDLTAALRGRADRWRDIDALSDQAVADFVRADGIDILVDLAGHAPGGRLGAFMRKPAPVQLSYLDYSGSTGLTSLDCRITVAACDPPGLAEPYYTERIERIPGTFWLYNPPGPAAPPARRPRGPLRLGSFNSFYRAGNEALDTWASILRELPGAEFVAAGMASGEAQDALRQRFGRLGVDPARLRLYGLLNYQDFTALIRATDIALAPFPYNGAMTMLDCLWQGVPVVALQGGSTFRTRMAHSILGALGLEELLAKTPADYRERVLRLAADGTRRAELRETLRERIRGSALQDFSGFPRSLEAAYRAIWRRYCATGSAR
jgi:predicted O-linked N-acetylglucosamine transferase (SPINDLY family)